MSLMLLSIKRSFFDTTPVEAFTARANKFTLTNNNLSYRTEVGNFEQVTIYNNGTSSSVGTAFIVRTSNTEAFIVNNQPTAQVTVNAGTIVTDQQLEAVIQQNVLQLLKSGNKLLPVGSLN